jgi:hypothetical protein
MRESLTVSLEGAEEGEDIVEVQKTVKSVKKVDKKWGKKKVLYAFRPSFIPRKKVGNGEVIGEVIVVISNMLTSRGRETIIKVSVPPKEPWLNLTIRLKHMKKG